MYIFKIFIQKIIKYFRKILLTFSQIERFPIAFYKAGASTVILALCGIYYLCEAEVEKGGVGVELYYAPMLDYILTTYLIFWGGTLLIDLIMRERKANSRV